MRLAAQRKADGQRTVVVLTSRQAAMSGASEAARMLEAPLAPHERVCFAYKISKAALNRGSANLIP